jgi:hypothetical protein
MTLHLKFRRWLLAVLSAVLLAIAPNSAPALAADSARESAVRAALIFNFIKFTEWSIPGTTDNPIHVCIASDDPELLAAVEVLGDRRVRGKPLHVARLRNQTDCEVIYVDSRQRWKTLADQFSMQAVLTIGAYPGFADEGGLIEINIREGGTRFDINQQKAKRVGLRFYPQFLQLARRVIE